jgi:hypothetical protein
MVFFLFCRSVRKKPPKSAALLKNKLKKENFLMQVLKAVVAEFDAGELITQRELVSHRVHQVICLL